MAGSLVALEHQTLELGGGSGIQAEFNAQQAFYYKDYLQTLLELGRSESAFLTVERSRARSLLTMLAERDLVVDTELPAEILQARKKNENAYDAIQEELSKLNTIKDAAHIEELLSRLRDLGAEREQMVDSLRKSSPRYAALRYPHPLSVRETRDTLDPGTILASFAVCNDRTVLFVIQPTGVEPGLSIFFLPIGEKALRSQVQEFLKLIMERRTARDSLFTVRARDLYDELLRPADSLLSSGDRLMIIPDGPLHLLPFQALMRSSSEYLIEWKPVNTAVSATVFAELKKTRHQESKPIELVAFGDPHYSPQSSGNAENIAEPEVRSAVETGLKLGRLPFSRIEVENISVLFPDHSRKYLGEQATEERAKALGEDVRYVHFAVHGLLDERFPLNSALVLTIPDKKIPGRENGLLQAWEIFEQMHLDADLVTLSACNSGLGEELSGEGLVGLTRAFQFAGAHSVISSFWSVDDLRTMELMTELYTALKANKSKEKALQSAQLKLLHSKSASAPYYWAGFMLIGDWR
jgi:CHAT domain-containing protein